ncbi:hypothetical protein JB92DRAFT_3097080 [Gautieria morchelliformis]|nr:hypothetical protein JB92DRAFT_3097080 [Gautieria morchelliformis]
MSYCRSLLLLLCTVHLFLSASHLQVFLVHIRDPRTSSSMSSAVSPLSVLPHWCSPPYDHLHGIFARSPDPMPGPRGSKATGKQKRPLMETADKIAPPPKRSHRVSETS